MEDDVLKRARLRGGLQRPPPASSGAGSSEPCHTAANIVENDEGEGTAI